MVHERHLTVRLTRVTGQSKFGIRKGPTVDSAVGSNGRRTFLISVSVARLVSPSTLYRSFRLLFFSSIWSSRHWQKRPANDEKSPCASIQKT